MISLIVGVRTTRISLDVITSKVLMIKLIRQSLGCDLCTANVLCDQWVYQRVITKREDGKYDHDTLYKVSLNSILLDKFHNEGKRHLAGEIETGTETLVTLECKMLDN